MALVMDSPARYSTAKRRDNRAIALRSATGRRRATWRMPAAGMEPAMAGP